MVAFAARTSIGAGAGLTLAGTVLIIPSAVGVGICGARLGRANRELSELRN